MYCLTADEIMMIDGGGDGVATSNPKSGNSGIGYGGQANGQVGTSSNAGAISGGCVQGVIGGAVGGALGGWAGAMAGAFNGGAGKCGW